MSHEQSETIQLPDGRWINVYGRNTQRAGQQLPGSNDYATVDEAVGAAKVRSATFLGNEHANPLGLKARSNMPTNQDDFLFSDSGAAPPASPLFIPEQPGIGIAPPASVQPPAARQTDLRREEISKMGGVEKFLSALGEFGAGVTGRPSPLNKRIEMGRQDRLQKLQEFKIKTDAIEDSVKWAQRLQGTDRTNFVNVRVQQLNEQSPGLGDQFKVFADKPDLVAGFREYAQHLPEPYQLLLQSNPDGFLKFATTPEGLKVLSEAKDKSTLRLATRKAQTAIMGWDKFAPPDVVANYKKDGIITASEFMDAQQYVPEAARLSEGELEVAMRTPGFWQALNIAGPDEEAEARKKRLTEGPQSDVGKLRADLSAGRITQKEYDAKMKKLTTHQPSVNVYSAGLTEAVDEQGNRVFIQPSPQEGVPPRIVRGVKPPLKPGEAKAGKEAEQADATVASVRSRIAEMSRQLQSETAIVGPAGFAKRITEAAGGVVYPGMETPAIDYQNNMRLLLSDVRKIVEKDPNLSKDEREALYETLGGGIIQTPGSAIRTLNNVLSYVEGKAATGKSRAAGLEKAVKDAGWDYEPDKYEYRLSGGKVQRRAKGK